jgi:hypothetical protein
MIAAGALRSPTRSSCQPSPLLLLGATKRGVPIRQQDSQGAAGGRCQAASAGRARSVTAHANYRCAVIVLVWAFRCTRAGAVASQQATTSRPSAPTQAWSAERDWLVGSSTRRAGRLEILWSNSGPREGPRRLRRAIPADRPSSSAAGATLRPSGVVDLCRYLECGYGGRIASSDFA